MKREKGLLNITRADIKNTKKVLEASIVVYPNIVESTSPNGRFTVLESNYYSIVEYVHPDGTVLSIGPRRKCDIVEMEKELCKKVQEYSLSEFIERNLRADFISHFGIKPLTYEI